MRIVTPLEHQPDGSRRPRLPEGARAFKFIRQIDPDTVEIEVRGVAPPDPTAARLEAKLEALLEAMEASVDPAIRMLADRTRADRRAPNMEPRAR